MQNRTHINETERIGGPLPVRHSFSRAGGRRLFTGNPVPEADQRARLIKLIHVAKRELGMDDGTYRAMLQGAGGADSTAAMDLPALERVYKRARQVGFEVKYKADSWRTDQSANYKRAARPLERKVWAMWYALGREGKLQTPTPAALQAFVKRQTGVDHVRWCNDCQLHELIEALKLWQERLPSAPGVGRS